MGSISVHLSARRWHFCAGPKVSVASRREIPLPLGAGRNWLDALLAQRAGETQRFNFMLVLVLCFVCGRPAGPHERARPSLAASAIGPGGRALNCAAPQGRGLGATRGRQFDSNGIAAQLSRLAPLRSICQINRVAPIARQGATLTSTRKMGVRRAPLPTIEQCQSATAPD